MTGNEGNTVWMRRFSLLFWDFDGVIKDSVGVKTAAFERLFEPFGPDVAARVREHHERNGGMSRYEKMPLYLEWAGISATSAELTRFLHAFSAASRQAVIDSAWVPGAREYLAANHDRQQFVLVTATPMQEIEDILQALQIRAWFHEVHGAPVKKADAITAVLTNRRCAPPRALFIGDSTADQQTAAATGVEFLLRRTPLNGELQRVYGGPQCEDFIDG